MSEEMMESHFALTAVFARSMKSQQASRTAKETAFAAGFPDGYIIDYTFTSVKKEREKCFTKKHSTHIPIYGMISADNHIIGQGAKKQMILMDKISVGDDGLLDPLKDKIKALRDKLEASDRKAKRRAKRAVNPDSDSFYDEMRDSFDDLMDAFERNELTDVIQDLTSRTYGSYAYGSTFGSRKPSADRGIWSDGTDFFDPFSFNTWSTRTCSTSMTPKAPRKTSEEEAISKISRHARKDWKLALLDLLFVNELCSVFKHDGKPLDEADASILLVACSLLGAPLCEFPLEEMEIGDAVALRNITMGDGISKSLLSEPELEDVKGYAARLSRYSSQVDDLCRIWAYASRKFCGTEHLVPVNSLEDLIASRGEKSFGNMDELAKTTGADVLLDAYFSGVPADDIIA